jgi:hypothetical protein
MAPIGFSIQLFIWKMLIIIAWLTHLLKTVTRLHVMFPKRDVGSWEILAFFGLSAQ